MSRRNGSGALQTVVASIEALRQLKRQPDYQGSVKKILPYISSPTIQNGMISEMSLRVIFSERLPDLLLSTEDPAGISSVFIQFVVLDYFYIKDQPELDTIGKVWQYFVNSEELRKTFVHRADRSLLVVYLEHFTHYTWNGFSFSFDGDWTSITLLDESLPFCPASLDAIFYFLRTAQEKHPNDLAIPSLGNNVLKKFENTPELISELSDRFAEIMMDHVLRRMLPTFLRALVDADPNKFKTYVRQLVATYAGIYPGEVYFAIGVACPSDEGSLVLFKALIDEALNNNILSKSLYMQAAGVRNLSSEDIIDIAMSLSRESEEEEDLIQPIRFLTSHLDNHTDSWFKEIAFNLMTRLEGRKNHLLEHLIFNLRDRDLTLIYDLFTARFAMLGEAGVLKDVWDNIVEEDPQMFSRYITEWFKNGEAATHRALLFLCSGTGIPASLFKISLDLMKSASSSEKLYIGYKIAGYIYSAEHLQELMFSIVETVRADEELLMDALFQVFYNYVIYNYRGTLDRIDLILKGSAIPEHLVDFYRSLRDEYDQYFADLDKIRPFKELQPDTNLLEYIQFYRQQKFSSQFQEAEKTGLSSLFKNTTIHSHRWAIRRPEQVVHEVHPLGHISTSFEFPSGEKLNPTHQELTRRTYQRLKKNEINID